MIVGENLKAVNYLINSAIAFSNFGLKELNKEELDINFEILESEKFNARSVINNDKYKIYFLSSVFTKTFNLLNCLLSEYNLVFYKMISGEINYNIKKANAYLDLMYEFSTKVIIYHELGHIYNGHLKYSKSISADTITCFYLDSENNKLPGLLSQALEADADAYAATACVSQLTFEDNINKLNINYNLIRSKQHSLIILIVSACIAFRVLGLENKAENVKDLKKLKYLPVKTRQDYFVRCALNAFMYFNPNAPLVFGNDNLDMFFFREVIPNIEEYVNLYYRAINLYNDDTANLVDNKIYINHCDFLDTYWSKTIRDKIKEYSYFIPAK